MTRRDTLGSALLVLGVVALLGPALFPVQPVLYHDTGYGSPENESQLREQGYRIVAYENLSERGRHLYVETLRSGGEHTVPVGEGAPAFSYPDSERLGEIEDYAERRRLTTVVIERPPEADLPPADEPLGAAEHSLRRERREANEEGERVETPGEAAVEERQRAIARYDLVTTRTDEPPLTATPQLLRIAPALLGILAIGTGGYLRSSP
ncbi:hypothetical protein [Haloarcula nitratireducens]|uniref:Uncharacterized protein n=1 Tax=Haloarcula nitratireducens TaxID=2487749 RepID=A0AAW4P6T8_9EURY|nr:hypothetical protein [Halomicroarcula nitratireducens]MBX0293594.1 hypothetical protein [Halomicroarcula nitratireducens]